MGLGGEPAQWVPAPVPDTGERRQVLQGMGDVSGHLRHADLAIPLAGQQHLDPQLQVATGAGDAHRGVQQSGFDSPISEGNKDNMYSNFVFNNFTLLVCLVLKQVI